MNSGVWSRSRFGKAFLSLFGVFALAITMGSLVTVDPGAATASPAFPDLAPAERSADAATLPASGTFAPLVKKAAPAVVSIQAVKTAKAADAPQMPFFLNPEDAPQRRQRGLGSGVIVTADGYILTNHHVVEDADDVKVVLSNDREFDAEIIGSDAKTDIAVLKVDATDLPTMNFGNSDAVEVGDIVLAIGNPFGLGQTVTMGIVGATSRQFGIMNRQNGYEDFIQTDAAINPGNSGGALVNARGEIVGINTAILSRSGGNNGVGFAVPINLAHHVMTQLSENGRVIRGYMGVGIQDVDPAMAKAFGAPDARGAAVTTVQADGPAAEAGFQPGDIIRSIDGQPVENNQELRLRVANIRPGEAIDVTVWRDGRERELDITLAEFPTDEAIARGPKTSERTPLGISVEELTPAIAAQLDIGPSTKGVVIAKVKPGSPAAEAGLRPGDVITEAARKPLTGLADFRAVVAEADDGAILFLVESRGGTRFVVVEP